MYDNAFQFFVEFALTDKIKFDSILHRTFHDAIIVCIFIKALRVFYLISTHSSRMHIKKRGSTITFSIHSIWVLERTTDEY